MVASWPGSVHDSRIFKNSQIYEEFRQGRAGLLLGDNGYGIAPFLLTPFINPGTDEEIQYNASHKTGRCVIERCNGQLKRRFHCIGSCMRIKLDQIAPTIRAVCKLHNEAKRLQDSADNLPPRPQPHLQFEQLNGDPGNVRTTDLTDAVDNHIRRLGNAKRVHVVEFLANTRL